MSESFRIQQMVARELTREVERNARHGWRRRNRARQRRTLTNANLGA